MTVSSDCLFLTSSESHFGDTVYHSSMDINNACITFSMIVKQKSTVNFILRLVILESVLEDLFVFPVLYPILKSYMAS